MTIELQPRLKRWRDLDLNFTKHPVTKDVSVLKDDDAVEKAIRNLVFTNFHERPFHPEIGCGIRQQLFENDNPLTRHMIRLHIEETIKNLEPRAELEDVEITYNDVDSNSISVRIIYKFVNTEKPISFTIILERVR